MKLIKVAAGALNQTPFAWRQNRDNILRAIAEAREEGASILCLPEMCITGYGCEDMYHCPSLQQRAISVLKEVAAHTGGMAVSVGLPLLVHNGLFNTAALIVDGRIAGFAAKRFLAGDGIHYEPRWFKSWPAAVCRHVEIEGRSYPVGDIYFDCGGVKVGFEICEDAWVAARPGAALSLKGVDIILNPSASHFAFGKLDVRKRFVQEGSRAFGVSYLYANLLGNESGRSIFDGGPLIASAGKLLALGQRFSFRETVVVSAVIDVDQTRMSQSRTASFEPNLEDEPDDCVRVPFDFPDVEPSMVVCPAAGWETAAAVKEEEFTRAVALALFDYLRKSRSAGFVVSLSGGADSAAVACLVAIMVDLAVAELGMPHFLERLAPCGWHDVPPDRAAVMRRMLSCVYQATENSSETTRRAARQVAEALGADFLEFDVDRFFKGYVEMVETATGRQLDWKVDDVVLQNIQARVRAPGIWLLANLRSALLLCTSNRSEAAVGYATMDGDTCGGLSPIAGIDKAFLKRWLVWLQNEGPQGLAPIAALAVVTSQTPTAELRPPGSAQTDEGDLMPYPVLDFIERAAIRDKQSPAEILDLLAAAFPQYGQADLRLWLVRFFRLWCRNQWKRERYAPSFHLDDENLDPKTWCRFPILSGGFEDELSEIEAGPAARIGPAV